MNPRPTAIPASAETNGTTGVNRYDSHARKSRTGMHTKEKRSKRSLRFMIYFFFAPQKLKAKKIYNPQQKWTLLIFLYSMLKQVKMTPAVSDTEVTVVFAPTSELEEPSRKRRKVVDAEEKQKEEEEEDNDCSVCCLAFTKKARKCVECPACQFRACRECVRRYIMDSVNAARCMNCKQDFTRQFLSDNMTRSFLIKDYRDHREAVILEMEKAQLGDFMVFAEMTRELKRIQQMKHEAETLMMSLESKSNYLINEMRALQRQKDLHPPRSRESIFLNKCIKDLRKKRSAELAKISGPRARYFLLYRVYENLRYDIRNGNKVQLPVTDYMNETRGNTRFVRTDGTVVEGRQEKTRFMGRCAVEGCNGFISASWRCLTCDVNVCKSCLEIKEEGHECDPDTVASVSSIRKDCKPCPNCSIRVFRIAGCSQMFCTSCNTGFCWNTGEIVRVERYFHNPHYSAWRRGVDLGGGGPPRGGCAERTADYYLRSTQVILERLHLIVHDRYDMKYFKHRLQEFGRTKINEILWDATNQAHVNRIRRREEKDARDLRVDFLLGRVSEKEFATLRQRQNKASMKAQDLREIKSTYGNICIDIFVENEEKARKMLEDNKPPLELFDLVAELFAQLKKAGAFYVEMQKELCRAYGHVFRERPLELFHPSFDDKIRDYLIEKTNA